MVTISLLPFAPKRIFALVLVLLGLSSAACLADSMLLTVSSTPYDRQMARIRPILATTPKTSSPSVSLQIVNHWIQDLRTIPYGFSLQWKTPSEVVHGSAADCKGKAVTLYQRMRASGATNLRLVIGRRAPTSRSTHTWVEWSVNGRTYVLDPTLNWSASAIEQISSRSYVPYFAYAGTRKYRAASATGLYARL